MGAVGKALRRPGTYLGHAREAIDMARAVVRYPAGIVEAAIEFGAPTGDRCHDTPVVLVHGYGHNRSGWFVVEQALRRAGFHRITSVNYNPLRHDVPAIAERLAEHVEMVRTLSGSDKVHVIGHSMGGLVLRWYVQELGGDRFVDVAATVATPHQGTISALLVAPLGHAGKQLLPGSEVICRLHEAARPTPVRWVAYYSNIDLCVQPSPSARLDHAALGATNVLVKDHGHLSILLSRKLAASVVEELERTALPLAASA